MLRKNGSRLIKNQKIRILHQHRTQIQTATFATAQLINIIAARAEDADNEVYKKVVEAYQTDEVKQTIEEAYDGAFICAF